MKVQDVLSQYRSSVSLGTEVVQTPANDLANDLGAISAQNKMYVNICVAFIVVVFVAAVIIAYIYRASPALITPLYGATGVSTLGGISQMTKLWKEKIKADMMLVLARNLRPEDIRGIIDVLLTDLR